jgi:CRISPR-associated protein Cas5t
MGFQTGKGYMVLMPRFLDYNNRRTPTFARYIILHRRVFTEELLRYEGISSQNYWIDPESIEKNGAKLGLIFHTFVGDYDDQPITTGMAG